jgi:hypothetical protein
MSDSTNPFAPPQLAYSDLAPQPLDELKKYAKKLAALRINPPTFLGLLGGWRMLVIVLLGVGLTLAVGGCFYSEFPRPYNAFPPTIVGSMFLGVFLRDIGNIRRVARYWKLQAHFIDWNKVDSFK